MCSRKSSKFSLTLAALTSLPYFLLLMVGRAILDLEGPEAARVWDGLRTLTISIALSISAAVALEPGPMTGGSGFECLRCTLIGFE